MTAGDGASDPPASRPTLANTLDELQASPAKVVFAAVALLILLGLWRFFWDFTGTLILGLFVYYVTRPVFARVHARIANRTVAVAVTIVSVALPVILLVGWTLAVAIEVLGDVLAPETQAQFESFVGPYSELFGTVGSFDELLTALVTDPGQFFESSLGMALTGLVEGLFASVVVFVNAGLQAFIVVVVTFYLLRDDHRIAAWARDTFVTEGGVIETYLVRVDDDLKNIYFGNILNALVTGLIAVVVYVLLNVFAPDVVVIPRPALVGLLVGVASLVPVVGIKLVTWPLGAYLAVIAAIRDPDALWFPVVFFTVSFVVVDYIPDQLLRPYVSGRGLHVGAVMLAYLFGPALFGWYGIFLGPFLLVLIFEFGRVIVPWLFGSERATGREATDADQAGEADADQADSGAAESSLSADDEPSVGATEPTSSSDEADPRGT